jgi:hypothetical protein
VSALPVPDAQALAADRQAVLLAVVDRALGPHATKTAITVEEYARDVARCALRSAYEAVHQRQIPSFRVAGRIRIPVAAMVAQLLGVETTNGGPDQPAVAKNGTEDVTSRVRAQT